MIIIKNVFFTIIIPSYNSKSYISNTIKSIIDQTFDDYETLIIDDNSSDGSYEYVKNLIKDNMKFNVYKNIKKGVSSARNYGIDKARGKYILFIDSDDTFEKTTLQECYDILNNFEYDVLKFNYNKELYKIKKEKPFFEKKNVAFYNVDFENYIFPKFLNTYDFNRIWGQCIKKDLIGSIRFDESLIMGEDFKFNLNVYLKVKTMYCLNRPLYNYLYNPNSITRNSNFNMQITRIRNISKAYFELYLVSKKIGFLNDRISLEISQRLYKELILNLLSYYKRKNLKEFKKLCNEIISLEEIKILNSISSVKIFDEDKIISDVRKKYKIKFVKNIIKKFIYK